MTLNTGKTVILTLETLKWFCDEEGDCLLWKLSSNSGGHPQGRLEGKQWLIRRYVWCRLLDNRIKPGHRLVSKCGNSLCVAPGCIEQKTHGEILSRAYESGNRNTATESAKRRENAIRKGWARLDMATVERIRAEDGGLSLNECAAKRGISRRAVQLLRQNRTWRDEAVNSSVFARKA